MERFAWYVLTPAGLAGPYWRQGDARDAARPMGWAVVRRKVDDPDTEGARA